MSSYLLSNLRQLEAESVHIIREVAAEFENPVMLYSIGKDSSVMLRLAQKAFHPGPKVVLTGLGEDAVPVGAVRLALEG